MFRHRGDLFPNIIEKVMPPIPADVLRLRVMDHLHDMSKYSVNFVHERHQLRRDEIEKIYEIEMVEKLNRETFNTECYYYFLPNREYQDLPVFYFIADIYYVLSSYRLGDTSGELPVTNIFVENGDKFDLN